MYVTLFPVQSQYCVGNRTDSSLTTRLNNISAETIDLILSMAQKGRDFKNADRLHHICLETRQIEVGVAKRVRLNSI